VKRLDIVLVEFTPTGGLFQFAFGLGEALARSGHDVELVTGDRPELSSSLQNFRITPLLPSCPPDHPTARRVARSLRRAGCGLRYLEGWRRLARHLPARAPDVVQWGDLRFALDGWLVSLIARRLPSAKQADIAHTPRPLREYGRTGSLHKSGPLISRALGGAYALMDVVFVLGGRSRTQLLESWPMVRRVEMIHHGDLEALRPGDVPDPGEAPPTALFFGTWARHKGLEVLLDAFEVVRSRLTDSRLVVAGPVGADVDYDKLEGRARAIGGIDLRPRYVPVADVPALLGSARVVVAPYLDANQSGVIHLAQTFARPVIATDVGDLKDVVVDGREGLLVKPGDPGALAAALERVLRSPEQATEMGRQGRARLQREASWDVIGKRVAELYEELVTT
jgi:glycosyltransferase involved in cell wall biosynthesis